MELARLRAPLQCPLIHKSVCGILRYSRVAKMLEQVPRREDGANFLSSGFLIDTANGRGVIKYNFDIYINFECVVLQ